MALKLRGRPATAIRHARVCLDVTTCVRSEGAPSAAAYELNVRPKRAINPQV